MIKLIMALNVCFKVHCPLVPFEWWRDSSQMLSIQPIGQIAVQTAVLLIDSPHYGKLGLKFQCGGVIRPKT